MVTFRVITLGCKVNQYDGAAVAGALSALGWTEDSASAGGPDLVVVNTCCVTGAAMAKSRQAVRRALRRWPNAAVVATGCYAKYDPARLAAVLHGAGAAGRRTAVAGRNEGLADRFRELAERWGLTHVQVVDARRAQASAGGGPRDRNEEWMSANWPLNRAADGPGDEIRTRRLAAVKRKGQMGQAGCHVPSGRATVYPPSTRLLDSAAVAPTSGGLISTSSVESPFGGTSLLIRFPGHQRAFVKVQDGCDAFCAYCVVPYTRPIVQWRSPELVERECRNLLRAGHKELVLCGVFLGAYGRPTARRRRWAGEPSLLPDLVRRIGALPGLWRLRLSSLEPGDLTDDLLDALRATPAAAWHFHLPLQSGSPRVLRRMNRQYAPEDFRLAVGRIRSACPDAAITTDILVGFPGEGDEDFRLTLEMARHAGFSKIHAFAFSAIEGTAAWTYRRESPPPEVVRRRLAELSALERDLSAAYRVRFVGRMMEALVEITPRCHGSELASPKRLREGGSAEDRAGQAMTDRYLTIYFRDAGPQPGEVAAFHVTGVHPDGLAGRLVARAQT